MWRRTRLWLASLLRHRRFEQDLADELAFHLTARTEHWVAQGLSPAEARRRARLEFGSSAKATAETRDVRRGAWLEALLRDVRHAARALRRYPAFSAMAILSLAIGIGANAAIFGVARAVLFPPSVLERPESLVNVYLTEGGTGLNPMSHPDIEDLRRGTPAVLSGIVASTFAAGQVDDGNTVQLVMGEAVTGGAFDLLGIRPQLGRAIRAEDDVAPGGHPVVMLSDGYWRRAFGADPGVVGRTLRMGHRDYTVIGVAPAGYHGGLPALTPAFYVPIAMLDDLMAIDMVDQRDFHNFFVKARLAPGATQAQADHAAALVASALDGTRPEGWVPGERFVFVPTSDVHIFPGVDSLLHAAMWVLMGVVGLVLLLACTNLASFLLARALDRGQEVAVRRALGATRGALARQLFVESTILGLSGAAVGLALALALLAALLSLDLQLPYGIRLDLHFGLGWRALVDWNVLALTAGLGVLAGGLLGLVPAVQGTRHDPGKTLGTGTRGSDAPAPRRWRNALVVVQIAISLVLLVVAGLFLRSWQQMTAVDPGFGRAPTAILTVMGPTAGVSRDRVTQRTAELLDRLQALPGVEATGLIWPLPLDFSSSSVDFTIDGHDPPVGREALRADWAFVDGGFFDAAGMALVAGRTFDASDRYGSQPVAIISRAMARRFWSEREAVGRILHRPDPGEDDLLVVGVVSDINVRSLGEAPRDVVYGPYTQSAGIPLTSVLVRSSTDAARLTPVLTAATREVDPALQVIQATTMARHLALSRLPSQAVALLFALFGVMATALAAIGVYGLMRHTVARRTREVGIRMALGADASDVVRLLVRGGVRLMLVGGALGATVSLLLARALSTLLFGVGALDPAAFAGAMAVLATGACLAVWLPARRARRVDPSAALRAD